MPKIFGKNIPPVGMVLLTSAAAYAIFSALPQPPAASVSRPKPKVSTSGKSVAYTPDDYNLHFVSYGEAAKNTFKPLVVRKDTGKMGEGYLSVGLTGDKGGWVYSGRVVVDGVPQGLLENRTTSVSEYVTRGQHWKNTVILDILADSIKLQGEDGQPVTVNAGQVTEQGASASVTAPGNVAPMQVPGMAGPIGGTDMSVQPTPGNPWGGRRGGGRRNWNPYQGNEE